MFASKLSSSRLTPILMAGFALALSGCEGTVLGHFDVNESLPETRIEGSAIAAILPSALPAMALDVTASESFQREEYDYLTSIQLDALSLYITESSDDDSVDTLEDGDADNFDFLSSIEIYIQATINGETHRELIGSVPESDAQLDAAARNISFAMTGTDIIQYIEAQDGYEVQIQISGESPPDAVIFAGNARYRVGVGFR